jgi:hypothetical protein
MLKFKNNKPNPLGYQGKSAIVIVMVYVLILMYIQFICFLRIEEVYISWTGQYVR